MRNLGRVLLGLALALAPACIAHLPPKPCELGDRMSDELARNAPIDVPDSSPLSEVKRRHFLFVAGFLNGFIPGYFIDNSAVLHDELGADTSTLFPSSLTSLTQDADQVRDEVEKEYRKDGVPLVLVGHSKGGAAVVLAVLRFPELLLSGKVDRVIAIQGAFGGSPLADSISHYIPVHNAPFAFRGLESLKTDQTKAVFKAALEALGEGHSAPERAWLSQRLFYVRSYGALGQLAPELQLTHEYLAGFGSGRNDGLLLEEDMKLEGVGVDLGTLMSDHASLTVSSGLSHSSPQERKAFTRALVAQVFGRPLPALP